MQLKIKKLCDRAVIPMKKFEEDACFDISVLVDDDKNVPMHVSWDKFEPIDMERMHNWTGSNSSVKINPQETLIFHTGMIFTTDFGYSMKVHVRSSTGIKKHLILANGTGIIDTATYRGELLIALTNIGSSPSEVKDLERVAQGEMMKTLDTEIWTVDEVDETDRGAGGFGSTGGH